METYVMFFASVVLTIIGFFIQRFFRAVDQIKNSLDDIKVKLATREEKMIEMQGDIHEIRKKQSEHSKRLYDIELQLAKNK